MKNSERIKHLLVSMAIEGTLPSDINELDSTVFSFCDESPEFATEDIIEHLGVDEKTAGEISNILESKGDSNLSYWENIENGHHLWENSKT